jgi:hypothetical protein
MKRYKIRKEQLERVVESFVMENNAKKGLNESELLKEGFSDLIGMMKDAVVKMSKDIKSKMEKDPEVKADMMKWSEELGVMGEDVKSDLSDLDNAEELLQEWLTESKGVLTEGVVGKLVGRLMTALGLGSLGISAAGFISQIPGWTAAPWLTDLHMYTQEICGVYAKFCGPLTLLAVALSIVLTISGVAKTMRSK